MQNQIIKQTITDNTADQYFLINPTKQQLAFFPKEESQMFQGRSYDYLSGTNPQQISENTENRAFIERLKETTNTVDTTLGGISPIPSNITSYNYGLTDINSSHTPTDYIGASVYTIPAIINTDFTDFFYIDSTNTISNLFDTTDTNTKVVSLFPGMQKLRLPKNRFNTILTVPSDILANNGSNVVYNYGSYHIVIKPKYFETSILSFENSTQTRWEDLPTSISGDGSSSTLNLSSTTKRRTIVTCDKDGFLGTIWNFENNAKQSGRLFGSVVEVWNSTKTVLKQSKVVMENQFNLDVPSDVQLVISPDNMGYDVENQSITTGDILRIYPRENYFDQIIIEISYQNSSTQVTSLVSFMVNDVVRDLSNGIIEIYDDKGITIDSSGNFNGNVIKRYQIAQYNNFEVRKKIN